MGAAVRSRPRSATGAAAPARRSRALIRCSPRLRPRRCLRARAHGRGGIVGIRIVLVVVDWLVERRQNVRGQDRFDLFLRRREHRLVARSAPRSVCSASTSSASSSLGEGRLHARRLPNRWGGDSPSQTPGADHAPPRRWRRVARALGRRSGERMLGGGSEGDAAM